MNRLQKKEFVIQFVDRVQSFEYMIVVRHNGLKAGQVAQFRRDVRDTGGRFEVLKNSLALKALNGVRDGLTSHFKYSTGVLFSQDPVGLSKVVVGFAKKQNQNFQVIAGCLNGQVLQREEVVRLSELPSLDEIRSQVLAVLSAPATRLARIIKEPSSCVARVLNAYSQKSES